MIEINKNHPCIVEEVIRSSKASITRYGFNTDTEETQLFCKHAQILSVAESVLYVIK